MKNIRKYYGIALFGLGLVGSLCAQVMNTNVPMFLKNEVSEVKLKYVVKDFGSGAQQHSLVKEDDVCVCSLTTMQDPLLTMMYDNKLCRGISKLPQVLLNLISAVLPTQFLVFSVIKEKYNLNNLSNIAMIFNLYVLPNCRGKGCAHRLLEEVSADLFSKGTNTVILMVGPFEIEKGQPKELKDENKKQRLIKLYQQCGFKNNDEEKPLFMYKDKNNF